MPTEFINIFFISVTCKSTCNFIPVCIVLLTLYILRYVTMHSLVSFLWKESILLLQGKRGDIEAFEFSFGCTKGTVVVSNPTQ